MNSTPILNHQQILVKLDRMACEICERFTNDDVLVVCGINQRGYFLAEEINKRIKIILPELSTNLCRVNASDSALDFEAHESFNAKNVLVIDDVINSGRTLMGVVQSIFSDSPKGIYTAFLAKREHRNFPVKADFVGISLATTLQEHVVFDNSNSSALQVYLN